MILTSRSTVLLVDPGVDAGLTLGALDLLGRDKSAGWWIEAAGEDADTGNPVPIEQTITSFLLDGSIAVTNGHDNREMSLRLTMCGTSSANLALGEQALMAEVERRNELTWTPPSRTIAGAAAACVFDVVDSWFDHAFSDLNELNEYRVYILKIKALPFARSQSVASDFSPPPPTTTPAVTVVDDCTVTTGWAVTGAAGSYAPPGISASGGQVHGAAGWPPSPLTRWIRLTRTGLSASMTLTPFVRVKLTTTLSTMTASNPQIKALLNGVESLPVAQDGPYYWFRHGASTLTSVALTTYAKAVNTKGIIGLNVDEVARTNTTSLSTTTGQRQTFRSFTIYGSTRAQGNITVTDTSPVPVGLGTALVHTTPHHLSGFQPDLRRRMVPGPVTTIDASVVSGLTSDLSTLHSFDFTPPPQSAYVLMARVKHATTGSYGVAWSASSRVGSTTVGTSQSGSRSVALTAGVWTVHPIAVVVLPTTTTTEDSTGATARVTLSGPAGLSLDEAWLFDVDKGRLTWVECGTGTATPGGPSSVLAMSAATLTNPVPSITRGDGTTLYGAGASAQSFGAHEFVPPAINVYLVTTGSVQPRVDIAYYPSFHSHVVDPGTST